MIPHYLPFYVYKNDSHMIEMKIGNIDTDNKKIFMLKIVNLLNFLPSYAYYKFLLPTKIEKLEYGHRLYIPTRSAF